MSSFSTRGRTLLSKFRPRFPEKWKGGRTERIRDYFMRIATDYKAAVADMVQDMKDSPKKSAIYLSLLGAGAVLAKTNPSELSFQEKVWHSHHDLLLVGDPIRSRHSDSHITFLQERYRENTLRYTNCGLFSLMWVAEYDPAVDKFEARCGLVKPRWLEFHKQVVDVGVLGRWYWLGKAMVDYDINEEEWDENGHKRVPSQFPAQK
ncbi:mitochondrial import inner membrane translocase subunit Tim29-like [Babylonia areolata]|uniref:mitochondrial import inner membrane translocase subunit Tim29-like n=1 Tax=Babylonia areolata TaxID=304850 RepID=UPI003FD61549